MRMIGDAEMSIGEQVARSASQSGPDFDPTVLTLVMTLYRTMAVFDRAHAAELSPHGLNLVQFNVMSVLHRAGEPMTMGDLAQAVSLRPANLTSLVDGLVKRGLVDRELNPDDRRSFLVRVSRSGEEFLAGFLPGHWRHLDALVGGLTVRQRGQLTTLLDRLAHSVDEVEAAREAEAASAEERPRFAAGG
jgi:DNA-binding MarR family transcriptional regulator